MTQIQVFPVGSKTGWGFKPFIWYFSAGYGRELRCVGCSPNWEAAVARVAGYSRSRPCPKTARDSLLSNCHEFCDTQATLVVARVVVGRVV